MFAFNNAILLRSIRATTVVNDAIRMKKCFKTSAKEFTTIVTANSLNTGFKLSRNHCQKCGEYVKYISLMMQKMARLKSSTIVRKNRAPVKDGIL